jgi:hypothetical protein
MAKTQKPSNFHIQISYQSAFSAEACSFTPPRTSCLPRPQYEALKEDKISGHVARIRAKRNAYRILVGKVEIYSPLGRPRRGWEDNITILDKMGWYVLDRSVSGTVQCRAVVNSVVNSGIP